MTISVEANTVPSLHQERQDLLPSAEDIPVLENLGLGGISYKGVRYYRISIQ